MRGASPNWIGVRLMSDYAPPAEGVTTPPIQGSCGHPNHGSPDHDCKPFLHGYGDESDCLCGRNFAKVRGLREHLTKMRAHHPNCYQNTGVPDDMPATLCDCRVLRMIDAVGNGGDQ